MAESKRERLLEGVAVTAELTGTTMSKVAARAMVNELDRYPEDQVIGALHRCRRELKGKMALADILSRLDDGRPGTELAWAMIPANESQSVVWTDEIANAYGKIRHMIDDDPIAARMAFKEVYKDLVDQARVLGKQPAWMLSPGTDFDARKLAVRQAVDREWISHEKALELLPSYQTEPAYVPRLSAGRAHEVRDMTKCFEELRKALE